jgi:organic hydroperoxide reductase OsmC/OhrA
MSKHHTRLSWERTTPDFKYDTYPREHQIVFGGGLSITASAAPEYRGKSECPNPEEALVFALSSCHMLTFLAIAAKRKLVVDRYEDEAEGVLEKNEAGKLALTRVTLRPRITWGGETPDAETLAHLHEASHRECFIANSVKTEVHVASGTDA